MKNLINTLAAIILFTGAAVAQTTAPTKAADVTNATSQSNDIGLSGLVAQSIVGASHDSKCILLTVVSPRDGVNRDLGLVSVSDLAAGSRVETDNLADEAGFAVTVVGLNAHIQLTEASLFSTRVLVSGKSLDDFSLKASKLGYTSFSETVACQAAVRQEDLATLARVVMRARRMITALASN